MKTFKAKLVKITAISALIGFVTIQVNCNNYDMLEKMKNPGTTTSQSPRKVFVSSASTTGSMSNFITIPGCTGLAGIAAADCVCRLLAGNAGLANRDNFIAWLSDTTNSARCRMMGSGGTSCTGSASGGPWYNTKGDLVAMDFGSLTSGILSSPILHTESGGTPTFPAQILTGTDTSGQTTTGNCANWSTASGGGTEHYGNSTVTSAFWTQGTIGTGCTNGHVYCFETK